MTAYTTALDTKNWDLLASYFIPNGDADFGNLAGVVVRLPHSGQRTL